MPLDSNKNPKPIYLSGTLGGGALNTVFPPSAYPLGSQLFVRDLANQPVYLLIEDPPGTPAWKFIADSSSPVAATFVLIFGASTVVAGARTIRPGGPSAASNNNNPSLANPYMVAPVDMRINRMYFNRTTAVGGNMTATLYRNFAATPITVALTGVARQVNVTAGPVIFAAGETIAVGVVGNNPTNNNVVCSFYAEAI